MKTSKSRKLPADLHPLLRPGFGHHHTLPPSAGHSALSEESEQILHRHGHVRHRFEHGPGQARQERGKAHPFRLLLLDGYRRREPGNAKDSRDLVTLSSNLLSAKHYFSRKARKPRKFVGSVSPCSWRSRCSRFLEFKGSVRWNSNRERRENREHKRECPV